jgi:hypothetical protein
LLNRGLSAQSASSRENTFGIANPVWGSGLANTMDASLITAVAALTGTAAGGTASFLASWLVHQRRVRVEWIAQDKLRRQNLYKEFIEEASKCYMDALQHHRPDILLLVVLYAKTSEMRVISSPEVLAAAERIVRRIVDTYSKPDIAFTELEIKSLIQDGSFDLLRNFGESCRAEFDSLRAQHF